MPDSDFVKKVRQTALYRVVGPTSKQFRAWLKPHLLKQLATTGVSCCGKRASIVRRRWSKDDREAIRQCFNDLQYDMPGGEHGAYLDRVHDNIVASGRQPLIVDCGANIGASVVWFSMRYPKAHIVAVEPAPDNFEMLRRNCGKLDVDARQAGIAAQDGRAYLIDKFEGAQMSYQVGTEASGNEIELLSLESILASKPESQYTPFLLKIDIEGSERRLFDGDVSVFERFPFIILEPHDWLMPGQRATQGFFRFHANAGREFCMKHENVASIAMNKTVG